MDRVTDRGLNTPEESVPNLEILVVTNTEISDVTLRYLSRNMPNLRLIDLRGTRVTEPGVIRLKTDFPTLQVICDFPEWTADCSQLPSDYWIDRDFFYQDDVKKPPVVSPNSSALEPSRHERIEIIDVGPGMVRLRRIVDRPFLLPVPGPVVAPEIIPEPSTPPPPLPRPDEQEIPASPDSSRSSSSNSPPPSLDNIPDASA